MLRPAADVCHALVLYMYPYMFLMLEYGLMQVTKLRRMLALFMREDEGRSVESL